MHCSVNYSMIEFKKIHIVTIYQFLHYVMANILISSFRLIQNNWWIFTSFLFWRLKSKELKTVFVSFWIKLAFKLVQFFSYENTGWATLRPKRQYLPSDNSSQATIRPKRQFVPSDNSSKRQFVPIDNSSQSTIRPNRQFVPSENSSQATIRLKRQFVPSSKKRQFVPICLIDQLITNLLTK